MPRRPGRTDEERWELVAARERRAFLTLAALVALGMAAIVAGAFFAFG